MFHSVSILICYLTGKYTAKGGKYVDALEEEGYVPSVPVEYEPNTKPGKVNLKRELSKEVKVNREVSLI